MDMSKGVAAWTEHMGSSVLGWVSSGYRRKMGLPYVGFMVDNVCPLLLGTNSLLIKRPIGCAHVFPLGAVSWVSGAIVEKALRYRSRWEIVCGTDTEARNRARYGRVATRKHDALE